MTERQFQNVAEVARNYLCCSCGLCEVICPEKAIRLSETPGGHLFPLVDQDLCTGCGICVKACPGIHLLTDMPEDPFKGEVLDCWVGKATREDVYAASQSGGGVTAVLLALLEAGRIKGAATVTMETGSPPRPAVSIARTPEDLLSAQGSKYCPVPVLGFLRDLSEEDGPVAMVGLACQVHGLHNAFRLFPELRLKVGPVIGLVCDRVLTRGAIDYLLWRSGVRDDEKVSFQYRSKEWRGYPGDVKISRGVSEPVFLPNRERMRIKDYFTPARCRLCFDKMNILADVTACDPWGIPGTDSKGGETALIARTSEGLETVRLAMETGHLDLRETTYDVIIEGQSIKQKERNFSGYCSAWRSLSQPLPEQAESVFNVLDIPGNISFFENHLQRALALDQFPSRRTMLRNARSWVIKQRLYRKVKNLFRC
jgi:coenzyme F420 hydrogenase subunit beta